MKLGLNAVLYRNTATYGSPTWNVIENVVDLNRNDSMEEADVTTRGSGGFTETEPTLRNLEITFQMVKKLSDADYTAFHAAFIARSLIDMMVLDKATGTTDDTGVRAQFKITNFSESQELRGAIMVDVTIKPGAAATGQTPSDIT